MKKCRRCGKSVADNARVCRYCGLTFTQSSKKDSYDRYRKKKMQIEMQKKRRRRRMRVLLFWIILIAIIGAVLAGIYANKNYTNSAKGTPDSSPEATQEVLEASEIPDATEEATEEPEKTEKTSSKQTLSEKAESYGCSIYEDLSYKFNCAYPSNFVEGTLRNNNTRVSLKDEVGGAEMLIGYEKIGKSDTAKSLMQEYIEQSGVDPEFNKADETSFSVTFTRIGRIYHRKAIVKDDRYIYYDFIYDQGSDNKYRYEQYIDFIDMYLVEGNKTSKKNS